MDIKQAVDVIDSCWSQGIIGECAEAWQTLKAAVLAKQTTNSGSLDKKLRLNAGGYLMPFKLSNTLLREAGMLFKFSCGQIVKDKITGFKGVVMAQVQYITGCRQYAVMPKKLEKGKLADWTYLDEDRLEKCEGKFTMAVNNNGGMQQTPRAR